jgi:hypothetical protein
MQLMEVDKFINTQLLAAETCIVCTEAFSATHPPVALPCRHIFGHECIKRWLRKGRGNTHACPTCRYVVIEKTSARSPFETVAIWAALCEQPPERLHTLMIKIWSGLQVLWQRTPSGKFSISSILDQAIIPALIQTARRTDAPDDRAYDPVLDCYNLVAASWDSLGRPDSATGLAIPLVRLACLMSSASATLPKWLTTNSRANHLIWRANACLGLSAVDIDWNILMEAADMKAEYFPLLHAYTALLSQSIAHLPQPKPWPNRRHEVMNFIVERCCTRISGNAWKGKPSNQFKDVLVLVYGDLRRYQCEKGKMSLRGHDGEEDIVKGIWALAAWSTNTER